MCTFDRCYFELNGFNGLQGGIRLAVTNSIFASNNRSGLDAIYATVYNSLFYGNCIIGGTASIYITGGSAGSCNVYGCLVDGDSIAGRHGIYMASKTHNITIGNCVVMNCAGSGIHGGTADQQAAPTIQSVLYYNNGSNVTFVPAVADQPKSVITASTPVNDAPSRDYTLTSSSDAIANGMDITAAEEFWDDYFVGANNPPTLGDSILDIGPKQVTVITPAARAPKLVRL
jgi:hypothetical protein